MNRFPHVRRSGAASAVALFLAAIVCLCWNGFAQTPAPAPIPAPVPGAPAAGPGAGPSPGGFRQAPTRVRAATNAPIPNPSFPAAPAGTRPGPGGGGPGAPGKDGKDAAGEGEPNITADEVRAMSDDDLVTLNLPNAPLDTALEIYAGLVRRVLLRPPQLAGGPINLKFEDLTRQEAIEAMNAVLALNAISVLPVGEKFVKVVPSQQAVQEGAKASDQSPDEFSELGQFITKMVKVTKVKPGDIAQAVQQFASGKVQNPVLVFDDQNFFILRDMSANVKRMVELIKELDVTVELDYKLEVIPIRYGRVDEIFDTLNSVVTGSSSGMGGASARSGSRLGGFASGAGGTGASGLGGASGLTGQTGLGNSSLSSRSGSSSRMGSGMTSPGAARSSLQDRLRQVSSAATGGAAGGMGGQFNLVGEARIIPNLRANSLIVYANKEDFKMLTNIVSKIDTLLAQVLIESIILEVSLDKNKDFGVSMAQNPRSFGNGWSGAGGSMNDATIATNLVGSIFPGGFSYFGQYKNDFAVAVTALATDSRARVLARPRIQTTHAQQASFRIGDTVPYPRSSQPFYGGGIGSSYQPFTTYDERDVVTELMVTPYITPDGLVTLEVEQKIDQLGPTTKVGQDEVPTIRTRSAAAVLSVRDGEPVILGGFITDRQTDSTSGVPWLKDIPLLGWAFRSKSDFKQRSELIVLIKPTILNTPNDASRIAIMEQKSLPNAGAAVRDFQREEAAMAERLGIVPGNTNAPVVGTPESGSSSGSKRKSSRRGKGE